MTYFIRKDSVWKKKSQEQIKINNITDAFDIKEKAVGDA